MSEESNTDTNQSLSTKVMSPDETDSITPDDLILKEIGEINAVTNDAILVSDILSTEEVSSTAILPMTLEANEVLYNSRRVLDDSYIYFSDRSNLRNAMAIKFKNEISILPNILPCNEHGKQSISTLDDTYVPILPSEITSGQNRCSFVSENEQENEFKAITIAQNRFHPIQRKNLG